MVAILLLLIYYIHIYDFKEAMDLSEPKNISRLLEGKIVGEPISDHHGIRCCPAMDQDSDNKYIIKILSVPASETQLDALLLTGAYDDRESALVYFKQIADGVIEEAERK